jgi:transposase
MWAEGRRDNNRRDELRYPSDLTDEEWLLVEPLIPPAKRGGNKRTADIRQVINGIIYVLTISRRWRITPSSLPARSTLHDYFKQWSYDGTLARIYGVLYDSSRKSCRQDGGWAGSIIGSKGVKGLSSARHRMVRVAKAPRRRPKVERDKS